MNDLGSLWQRKGATLSHKTAMSEFGLTEDEIVRAIRSGAIQCRQASIYGNPTLRLLRREVEALVERKHGAGYLKDRQVKTELASISQELKRLNAEIKKLQQRRAKLIASSKVKEP